MNDEKFEELVLISLESIQAYTNRWLEYLGLFRDYKYNHRVTEPVPPRLIVSYNTPDLPELLIEVSESC